jgi:hypothetical protein
MRFGYAAANTGHFSSLWVSCLLATHVAMRRSLHLVLAMCTFYLAAYLDMRAAHRLVHISRFASQEGYCSHYAHRIGQLDAEGNEKLKSGLLAAFAPLAAAELPIRRALGGLAEPAVLVGDLQQSCEPAADPADSEVRAKTE